MANYEEAALGLQAAGMLASQLNNLSANIENEDLLEENYKWNEKMFEKQMAYNWEMWNKTNAYNSPQSMVQRLLAAGINPALAMEKEGVATAAMGGSVSPGSVSPPTIQPYDAATPMSRVSDMVYNMALREKELQMADANIEKQEMENTFNSGYYDIELRRARHQAMRDYTLGLITMQEYQDMKNSIDDRMSIIHEDARLKRGQADYQETMIQAQDLENQLKQFHLDNAPTEFKYQMSLLKAQIAREIASGQAAIADAEKSYQEKAESIARTTGVNLTNRQIKATFWSTVFSTNTKNWSDAATNRNEYQYQSDLYDMYNQTPGYTDKPIERRIRTATGGIVHPVRGIFR